MKTFEFNKKCSCGIAMTTQNTTGVQLTSLGVWFTCVSCGSTGLATEKHSPMTIRAFKNWKAGQRDENKNQKTG